MLLSILMAVLLAVTALASTEAPATVTATLHRRGTIRPYRLCKPDDPNDCTYPAVFGTATPTAEASTTPDLVARVETTLQTVAVGETVRSTEGRLLGRPEPTELLGFNPAVTIAVPTAPGPVLLSDIPLVTALVARDTLSFPVNVPPPFTWTGGSD